MAATPPTHPRRRSERAPGAQMTPTLNTSVASSLRKSDTFNARTRVPSDLVSPIEAAALLPKRSPTNPKTLEELIVGDKHVDHIAKLLADFDLICKNGNGLVGDASILKDKDVLPVPTFMVTQPSNVDTMVVDDVVPTTTNNTNSHHHDSDSGLGSSVASSEEEDRKPTRSSARISSRSSVSSSHSTITGVQTPTNEPNSPTAGTFLSPEAVRHIKKFIVTPILREPSLQDFHPLIEDIPRRIGAKFISNLRDLEKTLFFLAPDYSSSPKKFLEFCETSIQCLQTTVDLVCEREQRRPTDRPYTNHYFINLVEQIRRYAEIMAKTRAKQEKGESLDEMDYTPDEHITIEGGLSQNGKPAALVRNKNGKSIALSDDTTDPAGGSLLKRPLIEDEEDEDMDEVYRSMARRRKSDKAGDVMHPCRVCDKEFKRPCDLTKHEKTHSRPWKCPDAKCRYHEQGWPTEKERDRHVNDKHSAAPTMYRCRFPPCTYSSKRESNCKQHMEKAHGWEYVRSKSNGRNRPSIGGGSITSGQNNMMTPMTPSTPFMATPVSDIHQLATPESAFAPSPFMPMENNFFPQGNFNYTPAPSHDNLFGMNNTMDQRRGSMLTVDTYSSGFISPEQPVMNSFEEALGPADLSALTNMNFDFNDLQPAVLGTTTQQFQQPTPALSIGDNFGNDFMGFSKASPTNAHAKPMGHNPHLSPFGQGNLTLLSPTDDDTPGFDEGFGEELNFGGGGDFTLYDNSPAPGEAGPSNYNDAVTAMNVNWFPDGTIASTGVPQFDSFGTDFPSSGSPSTGGSWEF